MRKLPEPANDRRTFPEFGLPPGLTLAELRSDLLLYANSAAAAVTAGEVMQARGGWAMTATLEELRTAGLCAGTVFWLLHDLIPYEAEFRHFLNTIAAKRAKAGAPPTSKTEAA